MNTIRLNTIGTPFPKAEGGGGDTMSGYRYYSIPSDFENKAGLAELMPALAKGDGMIAAFAFFCVAGMADAITAMAMDGNATLHVEGATITTATLLDNNAPYLEALNIVEITEEEFYSL